MTLVQGRFWRAVLREEDVCLMLLREHLPADLQELRDLRMDVPLDRWNLVVRRVCTDRKLLGGILLDFASPKDALSGAIASDRLLAELQRVVLDATTHLVEEGRLVLAVPEGAPD